MANLPWRLIFQLHIGFELCTHSISNWKRVEAGQRPGIRQRKSPWIVVIVSIFFFRVQVTGFLLLVNDSPFKWPCRQTLGCIYQCLCCFLSRSKFPFCKITSQKWLFNTCYGKIDLLNRNPIDQKLYACWRHPVPLNWPLDAQFRAASLPQYRS